MKEKSRTRLVAEKLQYAVLSLLNEMGGTLRSVEVEEYIGKRVTFDEWEKYEYPTGGIRWMSCMHLYSIELVKAGYITKKNGRWYLTDAGRTAVITMSPTAVYEAAHEAYLKWDEKREEAVPDDPEKQGVVRSIDDIKAEADKEMMDYVHTKNPFEFQDMVAALFRAMGFYTPYVAPKGKDGGVDIIAYRDPLGAVRPIIKAQVKHYDINNPVTVDVVRSLLGVSKDDISIVATSGRFAEPAKTEARLNNVRLIDGYEFCDLWRAYYDKMSQEDKALMPIEPVYFIKRDVQ